MKHLHPLIELRHAAVFAGGHRIFIDTSLSIMPGGHLAIVGPNGSGKSALAAALAGDAPLCEGSVLYRSDVPGAGGDDWQVGFPPNGFIQRVSFEDHRDLVGRYSHYLQGRYESLEGDEAPTASSLLPLKGPGRSFSSEMIGLLGLHEVLGRRIPQLSNGEVRKLLILKAILYKPRLLILDEPLLGLDAGSREAIVRLMPRVAKLGVTLLLVASRQSDVIPPVKNILFTKKGRISGKGRMSHKSAAGLRPAIRQPRSVDTLNKGALRRGRPIVELRNVTIDYNGTRILDGVNWTIRSGESWALVGPNGSGKTTLLSLILADNPQAYANDVRVFGHQRGDGMSIWEIKRRIGNVSPEMQIHFEADISALDVIASGFFDSVGLFRSCSPRQIRKAREMAEVLDLGLQLSESFHSLSEGQKRLCLIARSLVKSPRLLVFDEPCQGLDDRHRARVLRIVDDLHRKGGISIIYVTHDPLELPACITRTLVLSRGRVSRIAYPS